MTRLAAEIKKNENYEKRFSLFLSLGQGYVWVCEALIFASGKYCVGLSQDNIVAMFIVSMDSVHLSRLVGKLTMFPTRSDINRPVQSQKMARGWTFWFEKVEILFYPCSENKGADQLRGYREADLRLCFSHMQIVGFPVRRFI